jgi:hypothetical protein
MSQKLPCPKCNHIQTEIGKAEYGNASPNGIFAAHNRKLTRRLFPLTLGDRFEVIRFPVV